MWRKQLLNLPHSDSDLNSNFVSEIKKKKKQMSKLVSLQNHQEEEQQRRIRNPNIQKRHKMVRRLWFVHMCIC
ncbi:hypothetical protein RDI58_015284 [Solanum bulbocastanum]|uniref:Uncharacterized protein n=2 Tax=Solanum bulbocastanum TaxID=147425 RepID=A0AAN8YBH6_SOLBU